MFHAPSPKNTNRAQLYLNARGELVDRSGAFWGKSQIKKMALDAALPGTEWNERSDAVHPRLAQLMAELKSLVEKGDLESGLHKKLVETLSRHVGELGRADGAGTTDNANPLDRHGVPGDEGELDAKVREYLRGHGLDDESVERAIEIAKKDRAEAADRIPKSGLYGTGGHTSRGPSGSSRDRYDEADFRRDYPESVTSPDVYGEPVSERLMRHADPAREADERAAARLPGRGVSRRMPAGDASLATDAEMAREYGDGFLVTTAGY
jgi:hypothetical protein